jgi:predicted alpha/beta hydrolase
VSALPASQSITITASDGRTLGGLLLEAASPRGVLCINGATGFKREFYLKFASYCALRGYHALVSGYQCWRRSRPSLRA